ncbi:MFS transporter [Nocardioides cynanchi]|uniref:MFS transporter n=1 Tax=Nocardioides cynanchi TaxID=2558918 RepID=UPI00177E0964|nr:MFS transporter [Nocardioides cynanchi]
MATPRSRDRLRAAAGAFAANARDPALRRTQAGFAGACTAEWAFTVVLSVYAFESGGATAVGLVSLLRFLPSAVLAPFASTVADRWRRDLVLTLVSAVRCLATVGIVVLAAGGGPTAGVYLLATVSTTAALLYRPVNSALLPLLCDTPGDLASANVVRGLLDSLATLVGPALAAALLAGSGVTAGFASVAVLSALSAVVTVGLRVEEPERRTASDSVWEGLVAGAREVWTTPMLRLLFALLAAQTVTRGALSVFSVLVAVDLLGLGDPGVGTLTAALGAGAVIGSLAGSVMVGNQRLAGWFGIGVALWGLPLVVLAAVPARATALLLYALVGVGNALVDIGFFTLVARLAPERMLGRVFGLTESLGALTVGGGSVLAAALAHLLDVRSALAVVGALGPVVVILGWRGLRRLDAVMVDRAGDIALLRTVRVFDPLPLPALEQLAAGLVRRRVGAGQVLFEQGEVADGCYVIEGGRASVVGDGRLVATLGTGELVGEIGLLRRVPRTATVRAETELDLCLLDGDRFVRVVTGWETTNARAGHHVDDLLDRFSPDTPPEG